MKATFYSLSTPQEGQLIYYGHGTESKETDDAALDYPKLGRWQQGKVVSASLMIEGFGGFNNCWAPCPKTLKPAITY